MAATGTAATAATGKLLVVLLLGLTAPAAALAGYIEVGDRASARALSYAPAGERGLPRGPGREGVAARGAVGVVRRCGGSGAPPAPAPAWRSAWRWRSGCLRRRRGQMKGIGVAGGSGPPRPPQPPSRPRRRHILCGPCEAQTPTPPSPGSARASAMRPAARDPVRLGSLRERPCQPSPRAAPGLPTGSGGCGLCWRVGRAAGMRAPGQRPAPERLRSPQRVRPLLPVRLPLRIPALASDLREGLLNTIRLPDSDEPGGTLLRCRRSSLLWWVSASRDSTREYVVKKTLVEAYFFGVVSPHLATSRTHTSVPGDGPVLACPEGSLGSGGPALWPGPGRL